MGAPATEDSDQGVAKTLDRLRQMLPFLNCTATEKESNVFVTCFAPRNFSACEALCLFCGFFQLVAGGAAAAQLLLKIG